MGCPRCKGVNKNGKQCKRRTCQRFPYCWAHLRSILKLKVAKSTIPNANQGLFTLKNIKKGDKIVEYDGELKTQAEFDKKPSDYGLKFKKDVIIDAVNPRFSSVGRYANMCRSRDKK